MSIGQRLREEREARGLTQLAVANLVDGSERTVNDWERDVSSPKAAVLAALAAHGIDVRYVLTGKRDYAPPPPLTADEQTLLDYWRSASRDTKNAALGALVGVRGARQVFKGTVGQVVEGDLTQHGARFDMRTTPPAYAKPRAKPKEK